MFFGGVLYKKKNFIILMAVIILVLFSLFLITNNQKNKTKVKVIDNLTMSYYNDLDVTLDKKDNSQEYYFEIESHKDSVYSIFLKANDKENNVNNNKIMISLIKNGKYVIGSEKKGVLLSTFKGFDESSTLGNSNILSNQNVDEGKTDKYILKIWLKSDNKDDCFYKLNIKVKEIKKTPNIYLESEGGILDVDKISLNSLDSYLELPLPIKEGYTFVGWYTKKIGGVKKIISDLYNINSNITLYAHYEKIETVEEVLRQEQESTTIQKNYLNLIYHLILMVVVNCIL